MVLSLTFYKPNSQNKKQFLHAKISNHPIWKTLNYWESLIFESIKEEIENQKEYNLEKNETKNETTSRYKNIIFGQLASFSYNMLIFNFDKKVVKKSILNFCENHEISNENREVLIVICLLKFQIANSLNLNKFYI